MALQFVKAAKGQILDWTEVKNMLGTVRGIPEGMQDDDGNADEEVAANNGM